MDRIRVISNIFISFIGAGILGLPYAFRRAGLLEGVIVMIVVSYLSIKAMLLLLDCKQSILKSQQQVYLLHDVSGDEKHTLSQKNLSYSDVATHAFGVWGRRAIDASIVISQIGFCCAYLIFITENLSGHFKAMEKENWLSLILPLLFLLTLVPDLGKLAIFSLFAQISNLFAFGVVFWFDFEHLHLASAKYRKEFSLEGFPFFFSIAIYCFEGAGMIFSLEQSVPEKLKSVFRKYFVVTLTVVTLLYITFGAGGYLSFGPSTRDIITLNLPHAAKDSSVDFAFVVKSCLCLSLFFTYPIMMFPVTSLLKERLGESGTAFQVRYASVFLKAVLVTLTGFIVVLIPRFGDLMALVGATCCTLLGFIMPALCHYKLMNQELTKWQKGLDYVLIVVGVFGAILGTVDALKKIF